MAESNTTSLRGTQGGLLSGWFISRQNNSIVDRENEGKDYVDEAIKVVAIIVPGVHQSPGEKTVSFYYQQDMMIGISEDCVFCKDEVVLSKEGKTEIILVINGEIGILREKNGFG